MGPLNVIINVDAPKTGAGASLEKLDGLVDKIFLDGKLVASGIGSTFQLQAVDRGKDMTKLLVDFDETLSIIKGNVR